jgi:uncharacterized glyoxalase superfamily protein PhnB
MGELTGIAGIVVACRDPRRVAMFYRDVLGAAVEAVVIDGQEAAWKGTVAGVALSVCAAGMVDEAGGMLEGSPLILRFTARDGHAIVERARSNGFDAAIAGGSATVWGPEGILVYIDGGASG